MNQRQAIRKLARLSIEWAANELFADDHPEQPTADWNVEVIEERIVEAARELISTTSG